jgi:hypothetical protein
MDFGGLDQNSSGDEFFDSLHDALFALGWSLSNDVAETENRLRDAFNAPVPDAREISRLAGYEKVLTYAWGQALELNDRFTPAGQKISQLDDDPSFLPELMDEMMAQIEFMRATGGLLRSSMVLSPGRFQKLAPPGEVAPDLDRAAVSKGNDEALRWLKEDLFPLFKTLSPPQPPPASEPPPDFRPFF